MKEIVTYIYSVVEAHGIWPWEEFDSFRLAVIAQIDEQHPDDVLFSPSSSTEHDNLCRVGMESGIVEVLGEDEDYTYYTFKQFEKKFDVSVFKLCDLIEEDEAEHQFKNNILGQLFWIKKVIFTS